MLICSRRIPGGQGLAQPLLQRAAVLSLDWDTRQKSRFEAHDHQQRRLAVFLPRGSVVRGGDVLVAEDGSLVRVLAATQTVLHVAPPPGPHAAFELMRAAYHLGNRHVPVELQADHLKIEPDHVLSGLLTALGMVVLNVQAPFEPEGGAYGDSALLGHSHGDTHHHHGDHGHGHGHIHGDAKHPHEH